MLQNFLSCRQHYTGLDSSPDVYSKALSQVETFIWWYEERKVNEVVGDKKSDNRSGACPSLDKERSITLLMNHQENSKYIKLLRVSPSPRIISHGGTQGETTLNYHHHFFVV